MTDESDKPAMQPYLFTFRARTRIVAGKGSIAELGEVAPRTWRQTSTLIVSDSGVLAAGHTDTGMASLTASGFETAIFSEFTENPTTLQVEAGTAFANPSIQTSLSVSVAAVPWTARRELISCFVVGGKWRTIEAVARPAGRSSHQLAVQPQQALVVKHSLLHL